MSKRNGRYETHDFYCIKCGHKGINLMRKQGHQHERFHRKKLYCPYCQMEVNHIECKTYEEVEEFKENFENGVYKDEAEACISYLRSARFGEINLGKETNC